MQGWVRQRSICSSETARMTDFSQETYIKAVLDAIVVHGNRPVVAG